MLLCNVLRSAGSYFCPTDNFSRTFIYFGFMIFTQERISTYVDPRLVKSVRCVSNAILNVPCNCWERTSLISSNFQNCTFKIINRTVRKITFIQGFDFTVALNKKVRTWNTKKMESHDTFIPFKSQLYSKPWCLISLLLGSWNLVLWLHVWLKSKFSR